MARKRRCKAKTRAGKACRANPLHGSDLCLSHDVEARERARFSGAQPGAGRPKLPTPTDVARQLIEDNIAVVLEPHFRTLGYTVDVEDGKLNLYELEEGGAKIYGESKTGEIKISPYENLGAMIGAAEKLLDRVYGKPKQHSESKVEVTSKDHIDREIERLTEEMARRSNGRDPSRA